MCVLDFRGQWDDQSLLVEFAYNNNYYSSNGMAPYEALYGIKYGSPLCWTEVGEAKLHDVDLVQYTSKMVPLIRKHLKTTFSRHKSYVDPRQKDVEFVMSDCVFLKVSPVKGVMRFGKKGKLVLRYIEPFQIMDRVGAVAYRLELPPSLSHVQPVFPISMLRKYIPDPFHVL